VREVERKGINTILKKKLGVIGWRRDG